MQAWQKFRDQYTAPFFAATEGEGDAHYALDIIAARAWRYNAPMPVLRKAAVVREMANPLEDDHPGRTAVEAERALAFLVEHGMVDMEGDQITIPARFQQVDKTG
jgi:hypothetical protein